jgi:hypothetical protein
MPVRNENVERSVSLIIGLLDRLSDGESLGKPAPRQIRAAFPLGPPHESGIWWWCLDWVGIFPGVLIYFFMVHW